jgi:hypothetical protein
MNAFTKKPDLTKWVKETKKSDKKTEAGKIRSSKKGLGITVSKKKPSKT